MIEATDIIQKIGKRKFAEMATQQKGRRMLDLEKTRRWGRGKTVFQICQHGKVTIRNCEPTKECRVCLKSTEITKLPDFEPHFNLGLGCYVESKSEMRKAAKQKGLIHIGSDGIR